MNNFHILLGITGSPMSSQTPKLLDKLKRVGEVAIILTDRAQHFVDVQELQKQTGKCTVLNNADQQFNFFSDCDEWNWQGTELDGQKYLTAKWKIDPSLKSGSGNELPFVVHEQLCKWGDILIIAPLTINTLAKISNGICDNLLTTIFRAWNKPVILAPIANSSILKHPLTKEQLNRIKKRFKQSWFKNNCTIINHLKLGYKFEEAWNTDKWEEMISWSTENSMNYHFY